MKIHWVNHASFIFESENVRLLTDPWLFGTAFNDGWELLADSVIEESYLKTITHIWFSHEHPDHFHVPSVKYLSKICNERTKILYQETRDKRVINFCKAQGFLTQEVKPFVNTSLSEETSIKVGTVPFYDSWLCINNKNKNILNLNDCVLKKKKQLQSIQSHLGNVDILMPQFAYANWVGNPEDVLLQKEAADDKLDRLKLAVEVFEPFFTIPHASYCRFSHKENIYLNEQNNSIDKVYDTLKKQGITNTIILKPGDSWDCNKMLDPDPAISFYMSKRSSFNSKNDLSPSISLEELISSSKEYVERINKKNNKFF